MFEYRVEAIFPGDDFPTRTTYKTLEMAQRALIAVLTMSGSEEASVKITRVRKG